MPNTNKILSLVKDKSVRIVLEKALSNDGVLSHNEVQKIIDSTKDGKGIRYQEFRDLQVILTKVKIKGNYSAIGH